MRICTHKLLLNLIPLALGFGFYPLLIPILGGVIIIGFIVINNALENLKTSLTQPGIVIWAILLGVFLATYWGLYVPYHPGILKMPWAYFQVLIALSLLTVLRIGCINNNNALINFVWLFGIGALAFGLLTVGATVLLEKPPFYGSVLDLRYLLISTRKYINTPGIANLLCIFPTIFTASLLLKPEQRPKLFWAIGIPGFIFSLLAALIIGQRSYFIVTLVINPLFISILLLNTGPWHYTLFNFCTIATLPLLWCADRFLGSSFLERFTQQNLTRDGRFQMFQFWLDRLVQDPFSRIEVGPTSSAHHQWFHNFFADIHRLSGFWALLAAATLVTYIFVRIIFVIKKDKRLGLFLLAIATPCFLIMNASVVPEGERQPFLLLLAIGAINEVVLSKEKGSFRILRKTS